MGDTYSYRRGETNPIVAKVLTIQAVALGDAVGLSSGNVIRAQDESYSSLSQAQYDFASKFLGVATQRKVANVAYPGHGGGKDNRMRVATEGVFEFDVAATTLEPGQLMGMAKASGSALESQKVDIVADRSCAIGTVEEAKTIASATKCKVRIFSTKMLAPIDKN